MRPVRTANFDAVPQVVVTGPASLALYSETEWWLPVPQYPPTLTPSDREQGMLVTNDGAIMRSVFAA